MNIGIELPEDIANALEEKWGDLSQYATEILAVEGYRSGVLTAEQLHRMLSVRTRLQLEAFLEGRRRPGGTRPLSAPARWGMGSARGDVEPVPYSKRRRS